VSDNYGTNPSPYTKPTFFISQSNGSTFNVVAQVNYDGTVSRPGGGPWATSSDGRLKTNVQPLDHALDRLLALRGVTFEYTHPDNGMHPKGTLTGFVAQEVEPVKR
jgi:hypothetical protein